MEQYQLIGYPLGHSMSKPIHERLFALEGRTASYTVQSFPPEELAAHIPALLALDGFNITIPYKQDVIPYLDALHDSAALYGAVNTVCNRAGQHIGCNTDCDGFLRTMQAHHVPLTGRVCVLGAGGVGRMFVIEAARQGAQVTIAVRANSLAKATALAHETQEKCAATPEVCTIEQLSGTFDLLINATPVGMFPQVAVSPVPPIILTQIHTVFDCIYNPTETLLLQQAKQAGCKTVGGMEMLVWQAAAAHEYWNGQPLDPADVSSISTEMELLLQQRGQSV